MATSAVNLTFSSTITSGEIQAVWQWLEGVLAAGGFVKTTESGEVNTSTVTWPGSNGASSGFQIWRMDDALQATAPCFFKLELTRTVGANGMTIAITLGTGSDGSGTITGEVLSRTVFDISSNGHSVLNYVVTVSSPQPFYASANDGESFRFCSIRSDNAKYTAAFALERTKDSSGVATADGILIFAKLSHVSYNYGSLASRVIKWTGTSPAWEGFTTGNPGACLPPMHQTTGLAPDNDVAVYPFYHFDIGETVPPMKSFCGVFSSDAVSEGSTQTVNLFGTNHTMIVIGPTKINLARGSSAGSPANTNLATFMRYE